MCSWPTLGCLPTITSLVKVWHSDQQLPPNSQNTMPRSLHAQVLPPLIPLASPSHAHQRKLLGRPGPNLEFLGSTDLDAGLEGESWPLAWCPISSHPEFCPASQRPLPCACRTRSPQVQASNTHFSLHPISWPPLGVTLYMISRPGNWSQDPWHSEL